MFFNKTGLPFINRIRSEVGLPPTDHIPKGKKLQPDACPLANAMGAGEGHDVLVGPNKVAVPYYDISTNLRGFKDIPLPPSLRRWQGAFDLGLFPWKVKR